MCGRKFKNAHNTGYERQQYFCQYQMTNGLWYTINDHVYLQRLSYKWLFYIICQLPLKKLTKSNNYSMFQCVTITHLNHKQIDKITDKRYLIFEYSNGLCLSYHLNTTKPVAYTQTLPYQCLPFILINKNRQKPSMPN